MVYDVTIPETFNRVKKWINELKAFNKNAVLAIAGNKCDLNKFEMDKDELDKYCKEENAQHFYTSAKTGEGLDEIFTHIINQTISNHILSSTFNTSTKGKKLIVNKTNITNSKNNGCCK